MDMEITTGAAASTPSSLPAWTRATLATISVRGREIVARARPPEQRASLARWLVRIGKRFAMWLRAHFTDAWAVTLLATALSIAAFAYYSAHGLLFAYGDAVSHLMIARQVFASRTPGLAQLGTVWLPLTHMLLLPFVWNDTLWRDGLAAAIPSMISYIVSAIYLYRSGQALFHSRAAGWVAALILLLNPNVLYMQSTAMTEAPLICTAIVAIYYLAIWARTMTPTTLVKAAIALAAGTLIRYDGWALLLAATPIVAYIAFRRMGRTAIEGWLILFSVAAYAGCIGWVVYNTVVFHDPFYFFRSPYSAQGQQQEIESASGLPTHHNLVLSTHTYLQSVLDSGSLLLVTFAALGLIFFTYRQRLNLVTLPLYATLVPFLFNAAALYFGISAMQTPEIQPEGFASYFNVRYGMMMIPAIALFAGYLVSCWKLEFSHLLAPAVVLLMLPALLATPYVVREPLHGVRTQSHMTAHDEGQWIRAHYQGGGILISGGDLQSTIFYSDLQYREFITAANETQFYATLAHPDEHVAWIAVDPSGSNYDPVWTTLKDRQDWRQHFVLRATFGTAQVYQRIDQAVAPATPTTNAGAGQRDALATKPAALAEPRRASYTLG